MLGVPDIRTMLARLIATPSVSCTSAHWDQSNLAVVELLAEWLGLLGFHCEVMPVPGQPGKANLIATLGQGPGGLVLAGHTDTVPYDAQRWQSDPFILSERDNRFYGLGSCDMKGFFALAIAAARPFTAQPLKAPLIILATADEETSMSGARALVEAGRPQGRYAVIGEPTNLRPVRLHKGIMMEGVSVRGRSGHSSDPALGANALEAMHGVLGDLLAYRDQLQQRYRQPAFTVAVPTLNLGCIHGGDNPNRICGQCDLQYDLRPLPGMNLERLREEIHTRLQPLQARFGVSLSCGPLVEGVPAFETAADSSLVQVAERLTGYQAEAVAFATEAPFLQQLGMQTLVLGPGDIAQAHQPDEYLALERIDPMVKILTNLIQHYCAGAASSA